MRENGYCKFVFIGAGSSVFTLRLIGDILKENSINGGHIALVDIDGEVLEETKEAVIHLIHFAKREFEITAHTDYKQAIPDADYVFMTIATGGYERWKQDIRICTDHGVLQSVGDTIGPGGIIRTQIGRAHV